MAQALARFALDLSSSKSCQIFPMAQALLAFLALICSSPNPKRKSVCSLLSKSPESERSLIEVSWVNACKDVPARFRVSHIECLAAVFILCFVVAVRLFQSRRCLQCICAYHCRAVSGNSSLEVYVALLDTEQFGAITSVMLSAAGDLEIELLEVLFEFEQAGTVSRSNGRKMCSTVSSSSVR